MTDAIKAVQSLFGRSLTRQQMGVAADWCDERGEVDYMILAGWLRSGEGFPEQQFCAVGIEGYGRGNGDGCGYGNGEGDGYGSGNGDGSGCGYGYGSGNGDGSGVGYEDGNEDGKPIVAAVTKHRETPMPKEGDYVCVRSRDQGVVWGTLVYLIGRDCRLRDARQQYSWRGNATTLFDVVLKGPTETNCRLSGAVEEVDMTEVCGVILVPKKLVKAFQQHPAS